MEASILKGSYNIYIRISVLLQFHNTDRILAKATMVNLNIIVDVDNLLSPISSALGIKDASTLKYREIMHEIDLFLLRVMAIVITLATLIFTMLFIPKMSWSVCKGIYNFINGLGEISKKIPPAILSYVLSQGIFIIHMFLL